MDAESQQTLARLLREQRVAALGTLRESAPFVSMVLFCTAQDLSAFYIHASRLAQHTQDMLQDSRVSLMIAETDANATDPQQLARISMQGTVTALMPNALEYAEAKTRYLQKFPQADFLFTFQDFALYRIAPKRVRYVAGFAKAFNLAVEDLKRIA